MVEEVAEEEEGEAGVVVEEEEEAVVDHVVAAEEEDQVDEVVTEEEDEEVMTGKMVIFCLNIWGWCSCVLLAFLSLRKLWDCWPDAECFYFSSS